MILNHFQQDLKLVTKQERSFLLRLILSGVGILFLTWLSVLIQFGKPTSSSQELYYWAGLTLTTPILYYGALPFLETYIRTSSWRFTIEFPLLFTLTVCYFYSLYSTLYYSETNFAYYDCILLILFIVFSSRYLEAFCRKRVNKQAQSLSKLPSKQVKLIKADNQFHTQDLKEIVVGDLLYIAPGEYFPVDGIIYDSDTSVDESMITGEAHAIPKFTQDAVRAGSCNLDKAVTIKATSMFSDSYLGKMLTSMRYSQNNHSQPPCDYIAIWHQMITLTLVAAIYCWWLPRDSEYALYCAISSLLITCPCALLVNYPLTCATIAEVCAKKGILVKNMFSFLKFEDVDHILFDKTGTLTEGILVVDQVQYCNNADPSSVLPLIAVIEKNTHHPIAHAIVRYAEQSITDFPLIEIHRLRVFPGSGIRAVVDGKFVLVGSARWLRKNGVFVPADVIESQENDLNTDHIFVHCAIGGIEVARIQLKDKIRQDASDVIQYLKMHNIEISVLSGDRPAIVDAIAKQLGPIAATSQALPQDKEAQIAFLRDQGHVTAMVGDGLNDAPALKMADIGIAVGTGNPISMLCADIILQAQGLKLIQECFSLSMSAQKILKQNYYLTFLFNTLLLPFAAIGQFSPTFILIAICINTLLVMANCTRLKFSTKTA